MTKDLEIKLIKIEVKKLFGFYNYTINNIETDGIDNSLLIIYGDNGSGKTTLLNMIFYLLSPLDNSGHKTSLSKIKFNYFSLSLSDGTVISAYRAKEVVSGSYTISINRNGESFSVPLTVNPDGNIQTFENPKVEKLFAGFLRRISALNIEINFLSEDRKLVSFENTPHPSHNKIFKSEYEKYLMSDLDEKVEDNLIKAVKNLENWLKSNALKGTRAGEENANTIYSKLLKQISIPKLKPVSKKQIDTLFDKIKTVGSDSLSFQKSGLFSQIDVEDFENALRSATRENLPVMFNILDPYIDGVKGRLESLSPVLTILKKFLNSINDYFSHKTISYNVDKGFLLVHNELNETIGLKSLSSGEKQLIQLFCNVITSSEKSTIFIIDEPEISLNIKWQRKLIKTLLGFSTNKKVQFIFASHSIELLAGHRDSVHKLLHN